ncbi:hypothetical protein ACFX19_021826 [Malus domestica]
MRLHDCVVSSTREQKFQNINNRTQSDTGFFRYFGPDFCTEALATAALGCDPSSSTALTSLWTSTAAKPTGTPCEILCL